jgi:hypothetical protein
MRIGIALDYNSARGWNQAFVTIRSNGNSLWNDALKPVIRTFGSYFRRLSFLN